MESSPTFWQKFRRWIPGLIISLVAIIVLVRVASWQDLTLAFASIRLVNLTAAIVLTILSLLLRAIAWKIMLGGKTTLGRAFITINEGYLLNNIFPFKAGELGRAVLMGQASGLGTFHVLSTIMIERAFDMGIAAGILLATLPFAIGAAWAKPVAIVTLAIVAAGFVVLFLIATNHAKVKTWIEKLSQRSEKIQKWVLPRIASFFEGLSILTSPGKFLTCLGLIILSWAMWTALYYIMLLPLVPQIAIWQAAFVESVLALGVAVPSAPAALGVYEAAMVGGLSILGVPESTALGYAILMHFIQFGITGIFGLFGLTRERQSLSKLFSRLQRPQSSTAT